MGGTHWLEPGEQMSCNDLLYAIAVGSANDAAVAVAGIAGSRRRSLIMNARSRPLGMKNGVVQRQVAAEMWGSRNRM